MYCKKCGADIGDAVSCPECGTVAVVEKIGLISAYKMRFKNGFQFGGRSRRSEYWFAFLMDYILIMIAYTFTAVVLVMDIVMHNNEQTMVTYVTVSILMAALIIYSLVILIPGLALYVRRLHDIGKSGWWLFLSLVPFFGGMILFIFTLLDSQPGENKYGVNKKGE